MKVVPSADLFTCVYSYIQSSAASKTAKRLAHLNVSRPPEQTKCVHSTYTYSVRSPIHFCADSIHLCAACTPQTIHFEMENELPPQK